VKNAPRVNLNSSSSKKLRPLRNNRWSKPSVYNKKRPNASNWSWKPLRSCASAINRNKRNMHAKLRNRNLPARSTRMKKLNANASKTKKKLSAFKKKRLSSKLKTHARS